MSEFAYPPHTLPLLLVFSNPPVFLQAPAPAPPMVRLPGPTIVVSELAEMMEVRPTEVLKHLMLDLGIMATITQSIDADTARQVASNFEVEVRANLGEE